MVLSQNDREWVKLIAREVAFEANRATLADHVRSCPHGRDLGVFKARFIGFVAGAAAAGGGVGVGLANIFMSVLVVMVWPL